MATQRRQITAEEYRQLAELGVLGEKVELLDGWIVFGRYPFAFSEQAIAAARAAGIELDQLGRASGSRSSGAPRWSAAVRRAAMQDPEVFRAALAPPPERARTLAARLAWEDLEPLLLIRTEEGGAQFAAAVAWMAEADEASMGKPGILDRCRW